MATKSPFSARSRAATPSLTERTSRLRAREMAMKYVGGYYRTYDGRLVFCG